MTTAKTPAGPLAPRAEVAVPAAASPFSSPAAGLQPAALTAVALGLLLLAPVLLAGSDFSLTLASRACIAIVLALSYNLLLGQGGMLSFGQAVYSGLGAYFTLHALKAMNQGAWDGWPVSLLPLVGACAGAGFALVMGWVCTRRAGTTFAMISLGIGELVLASAMMLPAFFGGESGVSANRVTGEMRMGLDFSSSRQTYGLVAAWTLVCVAAIWGLTRTPFGRMANAVRDNPERVGFIGYSTHLLRWQLLVASGFFAGLAGGLAALHDEIVTLEALGAHASGAMLLMVFIGGAGLFYGPILGALVVVALQSLVSTLTPAWPFYFGLLFLAVVVYLPGGLASVVPLTRAQRAAPGALRRLAWPWSQVAAALLLLTAAVVLLVECAYRRFGHTDLAPLQWGALQADPASPWPWLLAALMLVAGRQWLLRAQLRCSTAGSQQAEGGR